MATGGDAIDFIFRWKAGPPWNLPQSSVHCRRFCLRKGCHHFHVWRSQSQHLLQMFPLCLDCVFDSSDADLRPRRGLGSTLSDTHGGPAASRTSCTCLGVGRGQVLPEGGGLEGSTNPAQLDSPNPAPPLPFYALALPPSWPGLCHIQRLARCPSILPRCLSAEAEEPEPGSVVRWHKPH